MSVRFFIIVSGCSIPAEHTPCNQKVEFDSYLALFSSSFLPSVKIVLVLNHACKVVHDIYYDAKAIQQYSSCVEWTETGLKCMELNF